MGEHRPGRWRSLKVMTLGRHYDDLPFGHRIMVFHGARAWCPPTDVFECRDSYVIKCEISGLRRDAKGQLLDAEVTVQGDTITIRGNRRDECDSPRCAAFQMEVHYGPFECQVQIQEPFDAAGMRAEYKEGFLIVTARKKAPEPETQHQIRVQS